MADAYLNPAGGTYQLDRPTLDIEFVAGASGAVPTSVSGYVRSAGINSMELAATGVYTVHLRENWIGLCRGTMQVEQATYDASHGQQGYVIGGTDVTDADDPIVVFQMTRPDTGAAIAVTEGDTVRITLEFNRQENQ